MSFVIGDRVDLGGARGVVVAIDGSKVTLNNGSMSFDIDVAERERRPMLDVDEARAILATIATPPTAPPPTFTLPDGDWTVREAAIAAVPFADQVELSRHTHHGSTELDADVRFYFGINDPVLSRVAFALGMTKRDALLAVRPRVVERAPFALPGHVAVGSFRASSRLLVADICYVTKRVGSLLVGPLAVKAEPGTWFSFIKPDAEFPEHTRALLAVHHAWPEAAKEHGAHLGAFGVDAGCGAIIDARFKDDDALLRRIEAGDPPFEEGPIGDVGVYAHTRYGDGFYNVRVMMRGDVAVALRLNLSNDVADDFLETPKARPYSPKERFAAGDRIAHATFGEGVVADVAGDKIDVVFGEDVRRLVHGKR